MFDSRIAPPVGSCFMHAVADCRCRLNVCQEREAGKQAELAPARSLEHPLEMAGAHAATTVTGSAAVLVTLKCRQSQNQ